MATEDSVVLNKYLHLGYTYKQDRGIVRVYDKAGHQICGATRHKQSVPCHNRPYPNGRCKYHGGLTLAGEANPSLKHGRYSRYLPKDIEPKFYAALEDEDLLSTRRDVALVDARIEQILEAMQKGETPELWRRLREEWSNLMAIRGANDMALLNHHIDAVNRIITRGANIQKTWDIVVGLLASRNKLVESERKYLVEKGQMVPAEEVMLMIGVIQDIIARHVSDRGTVSAIGRDLQRLSGASSDNEWVFGETRELTRPAKQQGPG